VSAIPGGSPVGALRAVALGAAVLLVSGCVGDQSETSAGPGTEPPAASGTQASTELGNEAATPPEGHTLRVEVADGRVAEQSGSTEVPLGEQVSLRVECDTADEVHVHGYDAAAPCAPASAAVVEFTADIPGVFEVELENAGLPLLDLTVR